METLHNNKIHILPEYIANQIAAGEVVQRPESVVKELVENSLDAEAKTIAVVIHKGGKQLIHVVDDGVGMSKEDLALSIKRHATSKIYTAEDLEAILTYGFRGEALASIASVANLEIRTKRKEDEIGWRLISEPNKEPTIEPISMDNGTQVFVRNLFFNVPARRKFLKSDITEFRYISDTLLKIALCRNDVRFVFYDEDSLVFDVYPSSPKQRIRELLGENIYSSILDVDYEYAGIRIHGFIGQPHLAKTARAEQYLFLNGRSIRSRALNYAVLLAYEHLLEKQTNPFFLLHIELDPRRYDVNVHPQKHEVKFDDEKFIFNVINSAVAKTLAENNLAPALSIEAKFEPFQKVSTEQPEKSQPTQFVNKITGEIIDKSNFQQSQKNFDFKSNFKFKYQGKPEQSIKSNIDNLLQSIEQTSLTVETQKQWKTITQIHNKFILIEKEDRIVIIDQHAAHERILFEKARKAVYENERNIQQLLFPLSIDLNPLEFSIAKEILPELRNLGFILELQNNGELELFGVPTDIIHNEPVDILKEIISSFGETTEIKNSNTREYLIATYSCKAAIKTGQPLSVQEMEALVNELYKCEIPYACPHGRPTIIEMSFDELDKTFCRNL
ncbi:MAG: DNA mismatch repair protein MutL [Candidatus Kapaibacterium sp.]|nr:MAG: DNA mismatch repair protein MutL [Candidatus Kapabacteria bacterium]